MNRQNKLCTLKEAVESIADGATLAIGGRANHDVPMALVREIARQRKQDLRIVSMDRGIDLGTPLHGDERLLQARLQAASMNLAFMPLPDSVEIAGEHALTIVDDPFTGSPVRVVSALRPDVAIIHAHWADRFGNIVMDADPTFDATLARAARRVIVSVEQIVSEATVAECAHHIMLHADEVACVIEAPYGAHPTSCNERYIQDVEWCEENADAPDHDAYLQAIGARRLFSLTRRLATKL